MGLIFSAYVIPVVILLIFGIGLYKRVDVLGEFGKGVKDGAKTTLDVLPALIAIMTAIGMFKASGALDVLTSVISPVMNIFGAPKEVAPLLLLRPLSGSGALAVVEDILKSTGADSFAGRVASVMMGSTETTFYTIAVYFGAAQIKRTRYTVPCALVTDFVGFVLSVTAVRLFCG